MTGIVTFVLYFEASTINRSEGKCYHNDTDLHEFQTNEFLLTFRLIPLLEESSEVRKTVLLLSPETTVRVKIETEGRLSC